MTTRGNPVAWPVRGATSALAAVCAVAGLGLHAQPRSTARPDAWLSAVHQRKAFEAQPRGSHRKAGYTHLITVFQTVYHNDPGGTHAAAAVAQVAELFAEEGREFHDPHEFANAARQYQYLAKAYPGGDDAPAALKHALDCLGPAFANDPAQASRIRVELLNDYPRSPEARGLRRAEVASAPAPNAPAPNAPVPNAPSAMAWQASEPPSAPRSAADEPAHVLRHKGSGDTRAATLTSIRHWSTSDYTRVAIDLGADVEFEAARVENPNRIFFDLHHTHLAPGIEGHSFVVTDDGFLTRIRASQYNDDTVRVVLDVHSVTDFSAFLLPNPDRLIIDIHGKRGGAGKSGELASVSAPPPPQPRPMPQVEAAGSSLPPMPVTDGSASFGLPSRSSHGAVAQPRVVVASDPTAARPVPNTVMTSSSDTSAEVAAVSSQPGKVDATRRPTSKPVVARTSGADGDVESSELVRPRVAGAPAATPPPTADGQTSLMRALGLKIGRIVIDAGHGGHDSGTLGVGGLEEKDVVLDVALRLGKLLHDRLGTEVVYTRATDTFVPLETRTAIANKAQADLFVSIHANSSPDAGVRGVEVYYLNFTNDADAMRVAARENAVSTQSVHQLSELVEKIALKDKVEESRELAADVDSTLYGGLTDGNAGMRNRGVKKAPFVVLIGANMPSILAEISFVTNAKDASELRSPVYRQRVAESLFRGVAQYAGAVNGAPPKPVAPGPKPAHIQRASARAR